MAAFFYALEQGDIYFCTVFYFFSYSIVFFPSFPRILALSLDDNSFTLQHGRSEENCKSQKRAEDGALKRGDCLLLKYSTYSPSFQTAFYFLIFFNTFRVLVGHIFLPLTFAGGRPWGGFMLLAEQVHAAARGTSCGAAQDARRGRPFPPGGTFFFFTLCLIGQHSSSPTREWCRRAGPPSRTLTDSRATIPASPPAPAHLQVEPGPVAPWDAFGPPATYRFHHRRRPHTPTPGCLWLSFTLLSSSSSSRQAAKRLAATCSNRTSCALGRSLFLWAFFSGSAWALNSNICRISVQCPIRPGGRAIFSTSRLHPPRFSTLQRAPGRRAMASSTSPHLLSAHDLTRRSRHG